MAARAARWAAASCVLAALSAAACGSDDGATASTGGTGGSAVTGGAGGVSGGAGGSAGIGASSGGGTAGGDAGLGGTAGSGGSAGAGGGLVAAIASCAPKGNACALPAAQSGLFATYRKDFFLPSTQYAEVGPEPIAGGRFHIAAIAQASGTVSDVLIDGQSAESLLKNPGIEWYHVWPREVTKGKPVWVAFHSRNPAWDSKSQGQLAVKTTGGDAVSGSFPVSKTVVPLTSVTVSSDSTSFLIHVKNVDSAKHTISGLLLDGRDVLAADVACVPKKTLEAGESALFTVPLCAPVKRGDAWTVVVKYTDAADAVGAGRVLEPFFPIEAWPKSADCPFPGGDLTNFQRHVSAGIDTQYKYWGSACGVTGAQLVDTFAASYPKMRLLVGDDFLGKPNPATAITKTAPVVGFLTGDESDGEIYDTNGVPNASKKAADARQLWSYYPELTVYNGAKTNKNVGTFAGMADVQGIDFYVAACAPHITQWGTHPPLRGAYDYLRNTRDNHAPLPTWMYAQGLHSGWNRNVLGNVVHIQPDPQEIWVQGLSVVAAGGKGLMWFQTEMAEADHAPARWNAIADVNKVVRGVRTRLHSGSLTGGASSDALTLVEAIRARDALIVPVITLDAATTPTDLACAAVFAESNVPHWTLKSRNVAVKVAVPDDLAVAEIFEVRPSGAAKVAYPVTVQGRTVEITGIPLSNEVPARLLVLAADTSVLPSVAAAMAP